MTTPAKLACACLLSALALPVLAQAPGESSPGHVSPQELLDEARRIQRTLEAVQAKVLEDESLSGKADALVRDVEARMAELDPQTPARLARLDELRQAAESAAAAEEREGYQSTLQLARELQEQLEATRSRVLAEDGFQLRTVAFQRELVDAMTVVEPRVPSLLQRLQELGRSLGR